ncbi:MAG: DUF4147 domain-containing protein [Acidobacteria bacterium]|nr:DUF4147 domain-containing protein [Acidobacteriota bacterium]
MGTGSSVGCCGRSTASRVCRSGPGSGRPISTLTLRGLREHALAIVGAGIAGADARGLVARALGEPAVSAALAGCRPVLVAAGKAAGAMAEAFVEARPAAGKRGVIAAPQPVAPVGTLARYLVGHPRPNGESVRAGRHTLELASGLRAGEVLVVLLSGGASAGLAAPMNGLTLEDKAEAADALMAGGVAIDGLNCVRKHLSSIKGGRLARAAGGRCLTLAISDVVAPLPDDPAVIGSGPTTPDPTTYADAIRFCRSPAVRAEMPASVMTLLERGARGELPETPAPGDAQLAGATFRLVGSREDAVAGARREAERRGFAVAALHEPVTGEARLAAPHLVAAVALLAEGMRRPACVLSAGETTVRVVGRGQGGRNQELALAGAGELARRFDTAVLASVGTDGIDGPTDAAGAVADTSTLRRAAASGLGPPVRYLDTNDSLAFFDPLGDLVRTGPTGTNVGDLQVALIA